jgi:hypothetical protein
MEQEQRGIKYTNSAGRHYVRVDLDMHGKSPLLEDFLDLADVEACKNEPKKPLRDVIREQNEKRGMNV